MLSAMLGAATRRRGQHGNGGWKPATQAASKHALSARLSGIGSCSAQSWTLPAPDDIQRTARSLYENNP